MSPSRSRDAYPPWSSARRHGCGIAAALKTWEPAQLQLGKWLEKHGKSLKEAHDLIDEWVNRTT